MQFKLSEVPSTLLDEILHLEYTIIPTLISSGILVTQADIKNEIFKDLEQTIIITKNKDKLLGVFRYVTQDNHIFVKSIFIDHSFGILKATACLGKEILTAMLNESADNIESVVQITNTKSLALHQKLGFQVIKENKKSFRFRILRIDLIKKLERLFNRRKSHLVNKDISLI